MIQIRIFSVWVLPSRHRYLLLEMIMRTVYQAKGLCTGGGGGGGGGSLTSSTTSPVFLASHREDVTTMQLCAPLANPLFAEDLGSH